MGIINDFIEEKHYLTGVGSKRLMNEKVFKVQKTD